MKPENVTKPVALADEIRTAIPTNEAAFHLSRSQQCLRRWSMDGNGPVQPVRIQKKLLWPVADLRRVLGVAQ